MENSKEDLESTESSISQVGYAKNESKAVSTPVIIGVAIFIGILSIIVMSSGDEEESTIDFTEEEYAVKNTAIPQAPEKNIVFKKPQSIIKEPELILAIPEDDNKLTQEQIDALKKAEKLRLRRLHSPVLKINKKKKKGLLGASSPEFNKHPVSSQDYIKKINNNANQQINSLLNGGANNNQTTKPSLNSLQTSPVVHVSAGYMENMSFKIAQGKVIPAILETAIQSNLVGMLRAIVSEAVYSEDGNSLLIPKGSRLIGEYQSGLKKGQGRIFIIWSRLIRPDGIDMKIDSPNTDSIGLSGMGGFIDYHFLERFGASVMMSLITAFAQAESDNDNQRSAISDSFAKSAEVILEDSISIEPTLHVNQGVKINVFVAKDLDFTQAILLKNHLKKTGRLR